MLALDSRCFHVSYNPLLWSFMSLLQSSRFSLWHTWMLVSYHKCASVTSVTNKYFLMPVIDVAASVLVHHWRSSAVLAGDGEGRHVQTKPLSATQNPAASPDRDGMTERPPQAGAVVILLLLPFDHPFGLFVRDPLSDPCGYILSQSDVSDSL